MIYQDWVRLAIMTGAALLFGATGLVCWAYARKAVKAGVKLRDIFVPGRKPSDNFAGLLPWHVVAISLSYDLFLLRSLISSLERWGEPELNLLAVGLTVPGIVLGLVAMWIIGNTRRVVKV